MKHISILALSVVTAIGFMPCGASAAPISRFQSNGVIANNIAAIQHSIMLNTFDNFGAELDLGEYAEYKENAMANYDEPCNCDPIYGEMLFYGEYGDDTGISKEESGHSGGDITDSNYNWFTWQHAQDKVKLSNYDKFDSRYDLISMGFANQPLNLDNGFSQFGGFGGLILAREDADTVELTENGGYIGIFQGYNIHRFHITVAGDAGLLFSDAKSSLGDYDFMNFWAGVAANASYDIVLSKRLILAPGAYAGYTYLYSNGYESDTGHELSLDGSHMIEAAPSLRAILNFNDGWFGAASARYVFNFPYVGDIKVAGATMPDLELKNYSEFELSVHKNAERFGFSATAGYHNGGRTGWMGGIQIRYVF